MWAKHVRLQSKWSLAQFSGKVIGIVFLKLEENSCSKNELLFTKCQTELQKVSHVGKNLFTQGPISYSKERHQCA